mgnify:CR=1 FL=1
MINGYQNPNNSKNYDSTLLHTYLVEQLELNQITRDQKSTSKVNNHKLVRSQSVLEYRKEFQSKSSKPKSKTSTRIGYQDKIILKKRFSANANNPGMENVPKFNDNDQITEIIQSKTSKMAYWMNKFKFWGDYNKFCNLKL